MKKSIEQMTQYELSRWLSLLSAIELIEETCNQHNIDFESVELNPVAIKHFINSISTKIFHDLDIEDEKEKERFRELFRQKLTLFPSQPALLN